MLDWAHGMTLRAVARGDCDDCPALQALVATGLVERAPDGACTVTEAGRLALEAGRPRRWEKILYPILAVSGAVVIVSAIAGWVG